MNNLKHLFPIPGSEPDHVVLAREWESAARYLRSSPLTVTAAAFAAFTLACDYVGADYLQTFQDFLDINRGRLPGLPNYTDPHTDGDNTRGK